MSDNSGRDRLLIKKLIKLIAVIVILVITAAITSSTYLERLAELTASLAYLDVIRKEYRP